MVPSHCQGILPQFCAKIAVKWSHWVGSLIGCFHEWKVNASRDSVKLSRLPGCEKGGESAGLVTVGPPLTPPIQLYCSCTRNKGRLDLRVRVTSRNPRTQRDPSHQRIYGRPSSYWQRRSTQTCTHAPRPSEHELPLLPRFRRTPSSLALFLFTMSMWNKQWFFRLGFKSVLYWTTSSPQYDQGHTSP